MNGELNDLEQEISCINGIFEISSHNTEFGQWVKSNIKYEIDDYLRRMAERDEIYTERRDESREYHRKPRKVIWSETKTSGDDKNKIYYKHTANYPIEHDPFEVRSYNRERFNRRNLDNMDNLVDERKDYNRKYFQLMRKKGARKEKQEHAWLNEQQAQKVADDHLKDDPKVYDNIGK